MKCNVSKGNTGTVLASLFAVVLTLAPFLAAQAGSTYYVSTSGSDSNPGTVGSPWLTIQHAASVAALMLTTEALVAEELVAQPGAVIAPGFGDLAEGLARPSSPV